MFKQILCLLLGHNWHPREGVPFDVCYRCHRVRLAA
jgi:hypothetical protein